MSDIVTRFHRDPSERKLHIERWQDCEPIIERNKAIASSPVKRDWAKHVATIPAVILERWINEEGAPVLQMDKREFARFIRRKLNDPDWRWLRTY